MLGHSYTPLILKLLLIEQVAEVPLAQLLMPNPEVVIRMNASPTPAQPSRTLHTRSTHRAGGINDG